MPLRLYNSLTKCEEEFTPLEDKVVRMYTCGPTVYGRPHIGNHSSFLMADLLRRWLEVSGYTVRHVKNITDVGHLVRDADSGEDKIEKQAREEHGEVTHESVIAIARKYEEEYLHDERALNVLEPEARPRASEFVEQMKEMIEALLASGFAYETEDGIYFDVTRFEKYGHLSGNTLDAVAAGARVEVNEAKRHPADFALWKFCVGANEHHALRWKSPGGATVDGFPGWHIECSAMSRTILGDTLDIHTGGEDNIFPHHECEIAQSESVTGKPFVRTWVHKRRIDMGAEKMSKSLGNVLSLDDVVGRGFDPMDLRYYLLSVHYRTKLKFTWKGMEDAKKARKKILEWMGEVERDRGESSAKQDETPVTTIGAFTEAMNADLNTPAALAEIFQLMNHYYAHRPLHPDAMKHMREFIEIARRTFGCFDATQENISPTVQSLLDARATARAAKNFAESDRLREEIARHGYEVKDTKDGQKLTKR